MAQDRFFLVGLKKSFLHRAQAIFFGRLALNALYLFLWFYAQWSINTFFPNTLVDLTLILAAFSYALVAHFYKSHASLGRWLHFFTLVLDVVLHCYFTRTTGIIFSPLMAIHPFLTAAFLLLFHNPLLMLVPMAALPLLCATHVMNHAVDISTLINTLALYCTLDALMIFFIHLAHSKEHRLVRSIMAIEKKLHDLTLVKERQRMAKEYHDGAGSKMASIVMQCELMLLENQHENVVAIKESAHEAIDDMRRSIAFLHDDFDIAEQVDHMVQRTAKRHQIAIEQHGVEELRALPLEHQIASSRIIQEAITNALKHGCAQRVQVMIAHKKKSIAISIVDDGKGFTEKKSIGHYGLHNMSERARSMGATIEWTNVDTGGAKILLEIPNA